MSTTGRTAASAPAAGDLAAAAREAGFVRLVATADGDALAATGLLARALSAADVPFQASVARTDAERERRLDSAGDGLALSVGAPAGDARAVPGRERPASVTAHAVARELGADPDPVLALAGAFAAAVPPGAGDTAAILEAAREADAVERRPGVAVPVADPVDGLAHTTLVHAGFSADEDAAAATVADAGVDPGRFRGESTDADEPDAPDEGARRRLASLVALEAAGDERATARAAGALERTLRPYATPAGPFATVGGYADVLEAVAREQPGTGVALALDGEGGLVETALATWRTHARAAHGALRTATTGRYDGLFAARLDGDAPVETVARLLLAYRSPEPAVLVVGDEAAAAAAVPGAVESGGTDVGAAVRATVEAVGGDAGGRPGRAYARHDGEAREVITAFREARR